MKQVNGVINMTVQDIINKNEADIVIRLSGQNPEDDCDPYSETYYRGKLGKIPKKYRNIELLRISWSLGEQLNVLVIPWINNRKSWKNP